MIARRREYAVAARRHDLARRAGVGGNERHALRHRLDETEAEGLGRRGRVAALNGARSVKRLRPSRDA